ncbi:hypothetical protein, partial [Staphylococcus pasteuri]|uniref:hypothetical protein n=1 Tax=Staphylococcus pasteuri TaxID=45972 RepID=UPI0036F3D07F
MSILPPLKQPYQLYHPLPIQHPPLLPPPQLSHTYITHTFLPDKPIHLLHQPSPTIPTQIPSNPTQLDQLNTPLIQ